MSQVYAPSHEYPVGNRFFPFQRWEICFGPPNLFLFPFQFCLSPNVQEGFLVNFRRDTGFGANPSLWKKILQRTCPFFFPTQEIVVEETTFCPKALPSAVRCPATRLFTFSNFPLKGEAPPPPLHTASLTPKIVSAYSPMTSLLLEVRIPPMPFPAVDIHNSPLP